MLVTNGLCKKSKTRVGIFGCTGRVGRRLCVLAYEHSDIILAAVMTRSSHEAIGTKLSIIEPQIPKDCDIYIQGPDLKALSVKPDVIIDFSSPSGTELCAAQAAELGIPLVIGTTGLTHLQESAISAACQKVPIIHAMNYSLGVNLMLNIVANVSKALGEEFNVEITETHHNKKVDAPSGTALALADSICDTLGRSRENLVHGRSGIVGKRSKPEIGMHALRIGSVIGDHTVHFGSEFERLEITHRAQNRDVFAAGALRAACWLAPKAPGRYSMADVLFGCP